MDVVSLTRQLVDIESISGNEAEIGNFLNAELSRLGYAAKKMVAEGDRCNIFATLPARPTYSWMDVRTRS